MVTQSDSEGWLSYMGTKTSKENSDQLSALRSLGTEELKQIVQEIRSGKLDPVVAQALGLKSIDEGLTSFTIAAADLIIEERQNKSK